MNRKKIFAWIPLFIFAAVLGVSVSNLDVGLRSWRAFREGKFSTLRLRYELAAFGFGKSSPNAPEVSKIAKTDNMPQVYIPAGSFIMGDNAKPNLKEYPEHVVYLDAFWMDKYEVSNAMYARCVSDGACFEPVPRLNPYYGKWAYRNLPVVYVNWYAAERYCAWAGRRLPTEAEWEKAARGADVRPYPWGDARPNPRLANFSETLFLEALPVSRYPLGASPYGVLNMAGNVREWVADWFDSRYYFVSPRDNPTGPETGVERSLRGGAYDADRSDIAVFRRFKHEPDSAGLSRGFRCAESAN